MTGQHSGTASGGVGASSQPQGHENRRADPTSYQPQHCVRPGTTGKGEPAQSKSEVKACLNPGNLVQRSSRVGPLTPAPGLHVALQPHLCLSPQRSHSPVTRLNLLLIMSCLTAPEIPAYQGGGGGGNGQGSRARMATLGGLTAAVLETLPWWFKYRRARAMGWSAQLSPKPRSRVLSWATPKSITPMNNWGK